jgi:putative sterol carrier protein
MVNNWESSMTREDLQKQFIEQLVAEEKEFRDLSADLKLGKCTMRMVKDGVQIDESQKYAEQFLKTADYLAKFLSTLKTEKD